MAAAVRYARARLRRPYTRMRRAWLPVRQRLRGTLTGSQLAAALTEVGVVPGTTVMVHISMDEIGRSAPTVSPLELIAILKELVTDRGTLLLPTFPFSGFEQDYLATEPGFDVRRTPSRMGLATEIFRRMPDTIRSLHPTHPVAGCGAHAAAILGTHHEGETFAETSPFCRMREWDGIVVEIGAPQSNSTIHSAEYLHPRARGYAFSSETHTITMQNGPDAIEYTFHPLRRRQLRNRELAADFVADGVANAISPAGLIVSAASAAATIEWCFHRIDDRSFYDLPRSEHP